MSDRDPLLQLLRELGRRDYEFRAVTPATHSRVLARPFAGPPTLRDIFGWNRPFAPDELDQGLLALLSDADALETCGDRLRSKLRVASLGGSLFLHSSFPTDEPDSVFFGPDTYRFARFIREHLRNLPTPRSVVDMGAGSGPGGILIARFFRESRVTLVDVNPAALRLAAINAAYTGARVETLVAAHLPPGSDFVIANPPYLMDAAGRAYRDGGDLLGGAVARDWVGEALASMSPGGTMLLYTGVAYLRGEAPLLQAISDMCRDAAATLAVEEIDPDVFGEELDCDGYAEAERISVVGAVITKREAD